MVVVGILVVCCPQELLIGKLNMRVGVVANQG